MSSIGENTLPDRWDLVRLEELSNISIGKTPPRSNKELFLGNNIWLSIRDLKGDVVSVSNEKITDKAVISSNMKIISEGTLLMSFKLTLGRTAFAGCDLFTNEAIASLPIKDETVLNKYFLKYALATIDLEKEVDNAVKGKTLNKQKLKNLEIPLPPLEEQKRIVAKIDTLFAEIDKAITFTEESLKKARNLLPSVLKEIFEEGKADGWEEKRLEEVCEKITDGSHNPPKSCEGSKLMMLSGRNIRDNKLDFEKVRFVSEKDFIKEDKRTNIQAGDVLLTIVGSIGRSFVFPKGSPKVIFQRSVAVIKPHSILNPHFLSYFFKSPKSQEKLNTQARGAAQKGVYLKDIRGLQLLLPNIETQNEKVLFLDKNNLKAKQTQSKLEEQLAYLKQLKSSILSKAFKGEL